MNDPSAYGIDLAQLDDIERRARERLSTFGLSADAPLPEDDPAISVEQRLLYLVVWMGRSVRDAVAAGKLAVAGEHMQRVRKFMDDATFADMAAERQKRSEGQETVSTERIIRALETEPTQSAAAASLNIDERTIRNRVSAKQRQAIKAKKRKG